MSCLTRRLASIGFFMLFAGFAAQVQAQQLRPLNVNFGTQAIGTSAAKTVRFTNTGLGVGTTTGPLFIDDISIFPPPSGPFSEADNCPRTLPLPPGFLLPGAFCTITAGFSPIATGSFASSIVIQYHNSAGIGMKAIALSGAGVEPVTLSTASQGFGSVGVGTASGTKTIILRNNLDTSLSITSITASSEFTVLSTIPSTVAARGVFSINLNFVPAQLDAWTGILTVVDSASNSPQTVTLTGTGTAASLTSISVSPQNASLPSGTAKQFFTATGAFPSGINLDLTTRASWISSNPRVATISKGFVKTGAAGTTTISAIVNKIIGSTLLTVTSGTKINQTISFTGTSPSAVYGSSFSVSATASSGLAVTITASPACTISGSTVTMTSGTGVCTLTASQAGNAAYNPAPNVTNTVTAQLAPATVTAKAASKTYGSADPALSASETGFTASDALTITLSATRAAGESVGTYKITPTATGAASANYNVTYTPGSLTINKLNAAVTANAASKTYGTVDPALTGTLTSFLTTDNVTATYARTIGETVTGGPYTISATLAPTAVLANYNITYNTASFTINKLNASVTPNAASKTYGTADPALTGTLTSFLTTDNVTATYARAAGETVTGGPYLISATLAPAAVLGNYTLTYNTANFTISQATPMFSGLSAPQSITFGTSSITLSGTIAAGSVYPPSGDSVSITINSSAVPATIGSSGTFSTNFLTSGIPVAGSPYSITYSYAGDSNFTSATDTSTTLTVNPSAVTLQSITVTPSNSSIVIGGTQAFTAMGIYSSGPPQDLTASAAWSSSAAAVATIGTAPTGMPGLANAIALGRATLTATFSGITGMTNLAVTGTGSFVPGGAMNSPRDPFTATLLDDGTVLIAGGYGPNGVLCSAELSDPLGQTFTLVSSCMTSYRAYHTATLLNNGKVLIVGGLDINGIPTNTAELYDPATQTFTRTSGLSYERYLHTATLLSDGRVLVVGGIDSTNSPVSYSEVYDPATGSFSGTGGSLHNARYAHTATLLNDGTVLIAGGGTTTAPAPYPTSQTNPTSSAELYTPSAGSFTLLNNTMNSTRAFHTATLLNDGTVLLAGGVSGTGQYPYPTSAAEIYSPSARSFSNMGGMSYSRAYHTATLLNNGMVLIAGGATDDAGYFPPYPIGAPTNTAELYDPNSGFTLTGSLANARSQHTATLLNNGEVLIAGGATDSGGSNYNGTTTNSTELYQPATLTPAGVTAITVNPGSLTTVPNGASQRFTATDNNGNQLASVVWSSSDLTVAIISNDTSNFGEANFVKMGPVTITACTGSICGSTSFTVGPAVVASIAITPQNPFLAPSASPLALTATGTFTDGTTQDITTSPSTAWTSSLTGVATIGLNTGVARPAGVGQTTITATSGSVSASTTLTVSTFVLTTGSLSINSAWYNNTATLLNSGLVLITPASFFPPPQQAELYDPGTGIFTLTGAMSTARVKHTATLLNDGTVLITGGFYYPPGGVVAILVATAEIYNPATGTFAYTKGPMGYARYLHVATLLRCACANDGKVLITGGQSDNGTVFNTAELYDPKTQTFAPTGSMAVPRVAHIATTLNDGTVLIAGGQNRTGTPNTVELFDPTQGTFTTISATLGNGLTQFSATLLNDGRVLFAGGSDYIGNWPNSRVYDPTSQTFTMGGGLNLTYRDFFTSTLLNNGTVLVTGGTYEYGNSPIVASTEIYDPATATFTYGSAMNAARTNHTATLLSDGSGKVLIAGGVNVSSAELYPPTTLTPPNLVSIAVTPAPANQTIIVSGGTQSTLPAGTILAGATQRFIAMGTFSSGPPQQLASVTWNSSNTNVAQISNDASNSGEAVGLSAGSSAITACAGTICSSSSTLTTLAFTEAISWATPAPITYGTPLSATQLNATANVPGAFTYTPPSGTVLAAGSQTLSVLFTPTDTSTYSPANISVTLTVNEPTLTFTGLASHSIIYGTASPINLTGTIAAGAVYPPSGESISITIYGTTVPATIGSNGAFSATFSTGGIPSSTTPYVISYSYPTDGTFASATDTSTTLTVFISGGFASTSGMTTPRHWHTATMLNDGTVLIAGGLGTYGQLTSALGSAEIYDPKTGKFALTSGNMMSQHAYHTATLLDNGMVLIAGGVDSTGNPSSSAELYDPAAKTFTAVSGLITARDQHTATRLAGGQVLIAGGYNSGLATLNSAELYDPVAKTFTTIVTTGGSLNTARYGHTATLLNTGKVLIAGGNNLSIGELNTAELFDPGTDTFSYTTDTATGLTQTTLTSPRFLHTATLLDNGTVLFAAGVSATNYPNPMNSAEIYDPATGTFTPVGGLITGRYFHTATLLNNGMVFIAGGQIDSNGTPTPNTELYDPSAQTFSNTADVSNNQTTLITARHVPTATLLNDGKVLITGGVVSSVLPAPNPSTLSPTASAELFQPATLMPPNLVSIAVTPSSATVSIAQTTQKFIATGTFSSGPTQQLASVTWSSTDLTGTNVAQISNDATNSGVASGLSAGTATITACAGTICGSATLTVQ
jgi:hypothetical protein